MAEARACRRRFLPPLAATLVLLAACAPQPPQPSPPPTATAEITAPQEFPDADYRQAAARGEPVFRIDPERSLVVIEVRRGGALARFGHDHVVARRDLRGYLAPAARRADLYLLLARLVVDEPALRAESGFDSRPSESDIAGTRANMLDKVLQAERHPWLRVQVRDAAPEAGTLQAAITLHGVTRALQVPVQWERDQGGVTISGKFTALQSDFGITPFSILGGAIQVQDRLELRFRIRALQV